jgi:hypothetical protein
MDCDSGRGLGTSNGQTMGGGIHSLFVGWVGGEGTSAQGLKIVRYEVLHGGDYE